MAQIILLYLNSNRAGRRPPPEMAAGQETGGCGAACRREKEGFAGDCWRERPNRGQTEDSGQVLGSLGTLGSLDVTK